MSRLLRCNRCGQEHETPMPVPNILGFTTPVKAENWAVMTLGPGPLPARYDLCEDCAEVLVEQFMVGAAVAPITQPMAQVVLPHDPMTDCQLVWNPGKGGFLCYHDDPELYQALIIDNAQNVAEGVPERKICSVCFCISHKGKPCSSTGCECRVDEKGQKVVPCGHTMAGTPCDWDKCRWVKCKDCDCTAAQPMTCQCSCHPVKTVQEWGLEKARKVQARITQLGEDMHTAGWAHSIQQTCSAACSEQHTYGEHCILEGVVQVKKDVPGQIMPPACGAECGETAPDGSMPNPHHTYNLGTCLMNKDTARAVLVVCPVCKEDGSMSGLVKHMADQHQMSPDYANCQWVDARGYNLDGRLISQQGEDLTEAYSEQEAAE